MADDNIIMEVEAVLQRVRADLNLTDAAISRIGKEILKKIAGGFKASATEIEALIRQLARMGAWARGAAPKKYPGDIPGNPSNRSNIRMISSIWGTAGGERLREDAELNAKLKAQAALSYKQIIQNEKRNRDDQNAWELSQAARLAAHKKGIEANLGVVSKVWKTAWTSDNSSVMAGRVAAHVQGQSRLNARPFAGPGMGPKDNIYSGQIQGLKDAAQHQAAMTKSSQAYWVNLAKGLPLIGGFVSRMIHLRKETGSWAASMAGAGDRLRSWHQGFQGMAHDLRALFYAGQRFLGLFQKSAENDRTRQAFQSLFGGKSDAVLGSLRSATAGYVSDMKLRLYATQLFANGLEATGGQLEEFFGLLRKQAAVSGMSYEDVLNKATESIQSLQTRPLATIGLDISSDLRKNFNSLQLATEGQGDAAVSAAQHNEAFRMVLEALRGATIKLTDDQKNVVNVYERNQTKLENASERFYKLVGSSESLSNALEKLVNVAANGLPTLAKLLEIVAGIAGFMADHPIIGGAIIGGAIGSRAGGYGAAFGAVVGGAAGALGLFDTKAAKDAGAAAGLRDGETIKIAMNARSDALEQSLLGGGLNDQLSGAYR